MIALSIRQPWAYCILNYGKDIENRTWSTSFRGRVLIHASKGMNRKEYDEAILSIYRINSGINVPSFTDLERGGIIGSVELVDCVKSSASSWFFGPYGFVLRDPKPLPFLPWKGQLGFFEVPQREVCQCCNGTGICPTIDGYEKSCLTCNGRGYFNY